MLRILSDFKTPDRIVLRLAGHIRDKWVGALRHACEDAIRECGSASLTLDLGDVSFIDAAGVALCAEFAARGVRLINGSLFAAEQLRGFADVDQ